MLYYIKTPNEIEKIILESNFRSPSHSISSINAPLPQPHTSSTPGLEGEAELPEAWLTAPNRSSRTAHCLIGHYLCCQRQGRDVSCVYPSIPFSLRLHLYDPSLHWQRWCKSQAHSTRQNIILYFKLAKNLPSDALVYLQYSYYYIMSVLWSFKR